MSEGTDLVYAATSPPPPREGCKAQLQRMYCKGNLSQVLLPDRTSVHVGDRPARSAGRSCSALSYDGHRQFLYHHRE